MADMDVCDEQTETNKCFRHGHQFFDNLNVVYNASSSMIIFWNKYQLFLYENLNLHEVTRLFTPEFVIRQIIMSSNYLVCLDCSGNIHVTSLKFKSTHKRLKTNFQPREQNIMVFVEQDDHVISLKLDSGTYILCLNKINGDFEGKINIPIIYEDENWPLQNTTQEKCLMTAHNVSDHYENMKQLFNVESIEKGCNIVIISLDKLNIFTCLFGPNGEQDLKLIKLYSCPSEICNIRVVDLEDLSLIIVLNSGTIIKLELKKNAPRPVPVHLNTAVSKFISFKDTFIYTDGASMWKTENTFAKINFTQYFVRYVKDFVRFGDQIICTTYSNLIYLIQDDDVSYLKPDSDVFCPAEKLLNNSEYLYKLTEEVDKNNELIERLNEEGNYITAIALSNRPDLMDSILKNSITIYEYYEDAVKENPDFTITENLSEYFKAESLYILVKIRIAQMEHIVNQVLSQLFHNSKIHITLFSEDKLLKTNTMTISESLSKINILIPLDYKLMLNTAVIKVNIKIVTHVPGAFDSKEPVWTTLYMKETILNSENFIKSDLMVHRTTSMIEPQETIEQLIAKAASHQHGTLFMINEAPNHKDPTEFAMYVKLPVNYTEIFQNHELFNKLNAKKAEYLSKQLSSDEFLNSNSNLTFEIGRHKVDVEVDMDDTPMLRIASKSASKALSLRNFFADLLYSDLKSAGSDVQFADYALYTAVENVQKAIKESAGNSNSKELQSLAEQLQKTIGVLPI